MCVCVCVWCILSYCDAIDSVVVYVDKAGLDTWRLLHASLTSKQPTTWYQETCCFQHLNPVACPPLLSRSYIQSASQLSSVWELVQARRQTRSSLGEDYYKDQWYHQHFLMFTCKSTLMKYVTAGITGGLVRTRYDGYELKCPPSR